MIDARPLAVLLPDFNITGFAGIFQEVQLPDALRVAICSTHISTVTPPPQLTGLLPRRIHFIWRAFHVDNMTLGWFFLRILPYSRSLSFRSLSNIHSAIIQDGSHLRSAEFTNEWSYSDTPPYACMVNAGTNW